MPEYQVLRCVKCETFQIQQLKVVNKWNCVSCGTKQSKKKVYAQSYSPGDLKKVVQDYNMRRGMIDEEQRKLAMLFPKADQATSSAPVHLERPSSIWEDPFQEFRSEMSPKNADSNTFPQSSPQPEHSTSPLSSMHEKKDIEHNSSVSLYREQVPNAQAEHSVSLPSIAQSSSVEPSAPFVSPFSSAAYANDVWISHLASAKPKILSKPS